MKSYLQDQDLWRLLEVARPCYLLQLKLKHCGSGRLKQRRLYPWWDVGAYKGSVVAKGSLGHPCNIILKEEWHKATPGEWALVDKIRRHENQPLLHQGKDSLPRNFYVGSS